MSQKALTFEIERRAGPSGARAGLLHTPHGDMHTPAFSPVGTRGAVKGVSPEQLKSLGTEVVLANTYHLYLAPGPEAVRAAGGLAKFMGWEGPSITDSGGFQVFSLGAGFGKKVSKFKKEEEIEGEEAGKEDQVAVYDPDVASQHGQLAVIDDEGVTFTSHVDGSLHRFTPERSVEIQHDLGADIFFAFDECTAPTEPYEYQKEAMERTHKWAERSLKAHRQNIDAAGKQAIYGIAQGGQFDELRRESAKTIGEMGFDGFGLGGSFSKKYGDDSLESALKMLAEIPPEMPVHGLGVGEPGDVLLSIAHGVDTFDCVAPTRLARHGTIYTPHGPINLTNERYRSDFTSLSHFMLDVRRPTHSNPPDAYGTHVGRLTSNMGEFTLGYVSHLLRSGEMLGATIASLHNLHFILELVAGAREAILDGKFDEYRAEFARSYYGS